MKGDDSEGLKALSAVQKVFPSALLAGGYLRDCWFGRSPKDIDIFIDFAVFGQGDRFMSATEVLRHHFGHANVAPMMGAMYSEMGDVNSVWDIRGYALPVQVIMLNPECSPKSRIREHDFDFCQIWHDGWQLGCTPHFGQMNAHQVSLVHCENQHEFDRSMRRWERLKVRYPDFTLVIPKHFQQYQSN